MKSFPGSRQTSTQLSELMNVKLTCSVKLSAVMKINKPDTNPRHWLKMYLYLFENLTKPKEHKKYVSKIYIVFHKCEIHTRCCKSGILLWCTPLAITEKPF